MITLYEYYDGKALAERIRSSLGDVYLQMRDGTETELKSHDDLLEVLETVGVGREGISLRLTNESDLISFVWLTMQAA